MTRNHVQASKLMQVLGRRVLARGTGVGHFKVDFISAGKALDSLCTDRLLLVMVYGNLGSASQKPR